MDRRIIGFGLIGLTLAGCSGRPEIVYAEWLRSSHDEPSVQSRFEAYVKAAEMAEAAAPKYADEVVFTPGKRDLCVKQIGPALKCLSDGIGRADLGFQFTPTRPFITPLHASGWRLLGRGLVWKIESAVKENDLDGAVHCTVLSTEFGLDLVGGGAMDASLGMAIADDARQALAPALGLLTPKQLDTLSTGLTRALERRPQLEKTIEHERLNMLAGVQELQDSYRSEEWAKLVKEMGPDIRSSVDRLKEMKGGDPRDVIQYFKGMAEEAEGETRYISQLADTPTSERSRVAEPDVASSRPWRKFARHFFGTLRPLLMQYDETLARTRLFVLEAMLQKVSKTGGTYPKDLSSLPKDITTDPYTGRAFPYRADGGDCRVYSVGKDLRDDGGQTDESFSSPDLRLELR